MRLAIAISACVAVVLLSGVLVAAEPITIHDCTIALDEEARVPAQEAGVLVKLPVREGQQVSRGDLLAQIDDVVPKAAHDVASSKLEVAKKQASDTVDVRYAKAGYLVAAKECERQVEANKRYTATVSETEVDKARLERDKFYLMIEKAQKDLTVAGLQQQVSEAELRAAKENVNRRQILSPLNAVVVELTSHEGEWVQAGDSVLRLLRMDLLRVEGFLNVKDYHFAEIEGRPVEVVVTLAHNERATFPGKVVFVKPVVLATGDFVVRAEVPNRRQGNSWLLSPGMKAEMIIQLK